jgi:hypothetical protein
MEVSLDSVDDVQLALLPTYRIDQSFEWNAEHGPSFAGPYPDVPETPLKDFFGLPVKSRFGLAASLGMTADWIGLYARLGFDILTYKTVRGQVRHAHAPPIGFFLMRPAWRSTKSNVLAARSRVCQRRRALPPRWAPSARRHQIRHFGEPIFRAVASG